MAALGALPLQPNVPLLHRPGIVDHPDRGRTAGAEHIVLMIIRDGGGTSGYVIGAAPKPSVAYERQQTKKN